MTNCNSKPLTFSSLKSKKVEAIFGGGDITADGGLLLLREVDKKLKLIKSLSQVCSDQRHAGYVEHTIENMLRQRIFAIGAGYEDVNDHEHLRKELCMQTVVGCETHLASSATLSRFENSVDRQSLVAMSKVLVDHFIAKQKVPPKEIILDFDPTDNTIYGHQDKRHYHGYYKDYCFLPLHVFCGDDLLVSMLRPSNIDGAKYAGAILKLLVKRFREAWPDVKITFRGDCAFSRKRILYWCERNNVDYVVGIAGNNNLQKLAKSLVNKAEQGFKETNEKQRLFGEFQYQAGSWRQSRRAIVKVEHHANGTNQRFLLTSLPDAANIIYDKIYCPRGDMENGIKQLKLDLKSGRNSCRGFLANQFRLLLSSIAYILINELRCNGLNKTTLARSYCGTVRLKLFKIGAVIIKNTRRIQFLLSSHHPYQNEFIVAAQNLTPS